MMEKVEKSKIEKKIEDKSKESMISKNIGFVFMVRRLMDCLRIEKKLWKSIVG